MGIGMLRRLGGFFVLVTIALGATAFEAIKISLAHEWRPGVTASSDPRGGVAQMNGSRRRLLELTSDQLK